MSLFVIILVLLLVVCFWVVCVAAYRIWWHPLAKFPGPKIWAYSRLPWLWHTVRGDLWRALEDLHREHGDTVRIAPNEITTLSMGAWQEIYTGRPLLLKDPKSQTPPLNGAHSLFTAENAMHKRIRGILAHGFSDKAIRDQSPLIEHHVSQLITRLRRELGPNRFTIVDINSFYGYVTFDTVTDLSYGESSACLTSDGVDHPWIQKFFLHAQYSTVRNGLRWYSPIDKVLDFLFLSLTRRSRNKNWIIAAAKVNRRLSDEGRKAHRVDILNAVMGHVTEDHVPVGKSITKNEVLSNALAVVIADCQLVTGVLTSCTFLLLKHHSVLNNLVQEVRGSFKRQDDITVGSTAGLVYLQAVLNETLRIQHPSPISLPRVVPAPGRVIAGTFVPGNSIIGVNLQNIHHSTKYWTKASEFHPERFLPPNDPRYDTVFDGDVKAAFIPFSIGPRNCIGARLFFAQARLALAKVIWNFDLRAAAPLSTEWSNHRVYIVLEPKPLLVELSDRAYAD